MNGGKRQGNQDDERNGADGSGHRRCVEYGNIVPFRIWAARIIVFFVLAAASDRSACAPKPATTSGSDTFQSRMARSGKPIARSISSLVVYSSSPTGRVIASELQRGLNGLLGLNLTATTSFPAAGTVVAVATPSSSHMFANRPEWSAELERLGSEGTHPLDDDRWPSDHDDRVDVGREHSARFTSCG